MSFSRSKSCDIYRKYEGVLPILKKNLDNLKSEINYEIIESDILNRLEFKSLKLTYDIIFLDPPYKEKI
jgi:16S rRNA (guanine966-N2)-methyltransferase